MSSKKEKNNTDDIQMDNGEQNGMIIDSNYD